jgi:hypothetical protein
MGFRREDLMKPTIEATGFGSITVDGERIGHDIIIRLDGAVKKRKKKLSKTVHGTSHRISLAEAQHVFEDGVRLLIIGSGQYGLVRLDDQAQLFFDEQGCQVRLLPTPKAIEAWNKAEGTVIGLFHVTC